MFSRRDSDREPRWSWSRLAPTGRRRLVAAGVAVVVLGTLIGVRVHLRGDSGCDSADDRDLTLTVTVAPTLAEPLRALAADFSAGRAGPGGRCVHVEVAEAESSAVLTAIATPSAPDPDVPGDVWIPESADWLTLALDSRTATSAVPPSSIAIASTPVVIAMPRPMAEQLGWPDREFGWADLFAGSGSTAFWPDAGKPEWGPFKVGFADPENSTAALRAVIGVVSARHGIPPAQIDDTTFDRDRSVQFDVLTMERGAALLPETSSELFAALWAAEKDGTGDSTPEESSPEESGTEGEATAGDRPAAAGPPAPLSAFPAYEYEVLAYNRGVGSPTGQPPGTPLVAFYPPDALFATTVPYVVMPRAGRTPARASAATAFGEYLRGADGQSVLRAAGLRSPAGDPPSPDAAAAGQPAAAGHLALGVTARKIAPPAEDAGQAALGTARRFFRHVHQRGSTLAVVDVSGSMDRLVPGTDPPRTRLEVAIEAALQGVRLFAPDDQVGLWVFANALDGTRGYRELSPVAPLNSPGRHGTHLDDLIQAQHEVEAAGATALYTTALAAFRHMNANYVEGRLNQVVILTDGRNENPGDPDEITLERLLELLRAEFDPKRPVRIITIGYSEDADMAALEQISAATGARAYLSQDPRDVLGVFIDAVTQAGT